MRPGGIEPRRQIGWLLRQRPRRAVSSHAGAVLPFPKERRDVEVVNQADRLPAPVVLR